VLHGFRRMEVVQKYTMESIRVAVNPWETMSNTTDGTVRDLRKKFSNGYGLGDIDMCMLTELKPGPNNLKLSHLLPISTKADVYQSLGFRGSDVNTPRNFLVLCIHVEEAFDALRISFVPDPSSPLVRKYVMKVWDERVLSEKVHPFSVTTINDYVGKSLTLMVNGHAHEPFRRVLSYHAFMAYWKWTKIGRECLEEPVDFDDSDYEGKSQMVDKRKDYVEQFLKDRAEEVDED
jgi:hypothetical protein